MILRLGFRTAGPDAEKFDTDPERALGETVRALIELRAAARKSKDFEEADRIRNELASKGVVLKDKRDPNTGELVTTWEIAR
jgi:cysteinyl-tRNA synthetase